MLIQLLNNPQVFTDTPTIGIASYEPILYKEGDKYYIRHFLISALHYNTQDWRVEGIEKYVRSAIGKTVNVTPGFHHIVANSRDEWLKLSQPYGIASITDVVFNKKYGSYDAISEVTNPEIIPLLEKGYIPPFYSPGVFASKYRVEQVGNKMIRVFEEWEIMDSTVVRSPAFRPKEMAMIHNTACKGGKAICASKLAAIAEDFNPAVELKNNFASLNIQSQKNPSDMVGEGDGSSKHVDTLLEKVNKELAEEKRLREITEAKNQELSKSLSDVQGKITAITTERDTLKTKVDAVEAEQKKTALRNELDAKLKLTRNYFNDSDARSKKVEEMIAKGFTPEHLDTVFEGQFLTEEEAKAELAKLDADKARTGIAQDKIVASTVVTGKNGKNQLAEGAYIFDEISELRL